jgi:hypothetical protein
LLFKLAELERRLADYLSSKDFGPLLKIPTAARSGLNVAARTGLSAIAMPRRQIAGAGRALAAPVAPVRRRLASARYVAGVKMKNLMKRFGMRTT